MKRYKFTVHNWKSGNSYWFYKDFPSAYLADRWAVRISFEKKNSQYMVTGCWGEEEPNKWYQPYPANKLLRKLEE